MSRLREPWQYYIGLSLPARFVTAAVIGVIIFGAVASVISEVSSAKAQPAVLPPINNSGCLNIGPSQGPQTNNCPTIVNPPAPRNPSMLYMPNGAQIGSVIGVHPSVDQTTVRFDRLNVPDDFPWNAPILIQNATISCDKPTGGNQGRIEGFGLPVNSYWTVTCKILGPA
jgi:hypothetical protein